MSESESRKAAKAEAASWSEDARRRRDAAARRMSEEQREREAQRRYAEIEREEAQRMSEESPADSAAERRLRKLRDEQRRALGLIGLSPAELRARWAAEDLAQERELEAERRQFGAAASRAADAFSASMRESYGCAYAEPFLPSPAFEDAANELADIWLQSQGFQEEPS